MKNPHSQPRTDPGPFDGPERTAVAGGGSSPDTPESPHCLVAGDRARLPDLRKSPAVVLSESSRKYLQAAAAGRVEPHPTRSYTRAGSGDLPTLHGIEELYRFREIPVSPAMREELLYTKLPLAPPEQLLDTRPPRDGGRARVDRNAPTEHSLQPLALRSAPDQGFGLRGLPSARPARWGQQRWIALVLALLAILGVVGTLLRVRRQPPRAQEPRSANEAAQQPVTSHPRLR